MAMLNNQMVTPKKIEMRVQDLIDDVSPVLVCSRFLCFYIFVGVCVYIYNNVIHVYYMDRFIASSNWVVWEKNCEDPTSDLVGEFEDDWMICK